MAFNVSKRVSDLRRQADESGSGNWKRFSVTLYALLTLSFFTFIFLPKAPGLKEEVSESQKIRLDTQKKIKWLDDSWIVFPGTKSSFESFAENLVDSLPEEEITSDEEDEGSLFEENAIEHWLLYTFIEIGLRIGFIVLAFWPIWLLASIAGAWIGWHGFKKVKSINVLSVLDRKKSPFYSGIWGPLRPNNSFSGTDLSCPGLACPKQENKKKTLKTGLCQTLKKFSAFNETNLQLLQVVLAHGEFPGVVGEEIAVQPEEHDTTQAGIEERKSNTGYVQIEDGQTLLDTCSESLPAILEAHQRLAGYRKKLEAKKFTAAVLDQNYPAHRNNIAKIAAGLSPLAAQLVEGLTPRRAWSLGGLSPAMIASCCLAIESGKCLVFKKDDGGFARISNYPHLQARAVIQSIPDYHFEYNGDSRLVIRQAIICSRRHGDFARAFLPNRMPVESRALRDWLEIIYAEPSRREITANLVELDSNLEEIGSNWKVGLTNFLKQGIDQGAENVYSADQGIPHKSVVLFPLAKVVELSLKGIHVERLQRIFKLLPLTSKFQTHLSVSARLPGFSRQASDVNAENENSDKIVQALKRENKNQTEQLLPRWRIVRRMLNRYNWLSTRVGDDSVPLVGIVRTEVTKGPKSLIASAESKEVYPSMIPIRQRRLVELFGKNWEAILYKKAPSPESVEVFVDEGSSAESRQKDKAEIFAQPDDEANVALS